MNIGVGSCGLILPPTPPTPPHPTSSDLEMRNYLAIACEASFVTVKQHPMHASSWTLSQAAMPG